ncbi:Thiamine pyrophosphate enzyme, central domain family [Nitrospira sp. KM1]|uniref:acetolactate synthase large subunit n=1 Tax=Nitrospira sp. KM1 TaxID=1936990 RepID=UPI0013A7B339|nr:acetolactate synthase large subunit [Nitrospira sp. KM1]BCA53613.1 Thiamine pyrophosphate enzyme, central domain family [Nitrospira sp. KM1]
MGTKGAELVIRCLENEGVRYVFTVPGEETLDIMDALLNSNIRVIETRHEQGAAFMADVHGRLCGRAGVCLSTLGPGATNLLTGVADAYLDRAPLVAISGQASLNRRHKESHQYIDVVGMFKPVTKWNTSLPKAEVIPEAIRKAFKIAQTEKPGATHIELPEDVAEETLSGDRMVEPLLVQAPVLPEPTPKQVARAVDLLAGAQRPVILAGNGVIRGRAHEEVRRLAQRIQIPVLHTFMAKGVVPDSDPLSLYTLGLQARDYASVVVEQADAVIAIGYDFVEYAPCLWNPHRNKRIIHVDATPAEVDEHYLPDVGVLGDIRLACDHLTEQLTTFPAEWARRARATIVEKLDAESAGAAGWPLRPQHIMRALRSVLAPQDQIICDVGAHKLWLARMFPCETPNSCIISNGFASMGIALPGAVAAKLLYPDRRVIAVTGDGGFLMNSQELETAVRLQLPLVVLVWRDGGYGVIRWKQMVKFHRTSSVDFGNPDLVGYAKSFGAAGFRVAHPSDLIPVLTNALASTIPAVIDCPVDYEENLRLTERLKSLSH